MSEIITIILPVFSLIAFGYFVTLSGLMSDEVGDALSRFIFVIAIPALLIKILATADFSAASPWALWFAYFVAVAIVWTISAIITTRVFGRDKRSAVIAGVSAGFSNLVLVGIPLVDRAYGDEGLAVLVLLVSVHMLVMTTTTTLLMEHAIRADGVENTTYDLPGQLKSIGTGIFTNSIILGILAGLAWKASTVPFVGLPAELIGTIGATAGPLALLSIGMGLNKYGLKGNLRQGALLAFLSLFVMPVVVYVLCRNVFFLPYLWLKVAVICAGLPAGVNAYLFASYFKVAEGLACNTIILTVGGSVFSLSFWLWFLG